MQRTPAGAQRACTGGRLADLLDAARIVIGRIDAARIVIGRIDIGHIPGADTHLGA